MLSLMFGIAAALMWGVHDVLVRFVSARTGAGTAFLCVLGFGTLVVALAAAAQGVDLGALTGTAWALAGLSGFSYALGGYSLYRAFEIGPVRLVAPVLGSYPILSLIWATLQGQPPSAGQVAAVLLVIAGVGLIASLSDSSDAATGHKRAALVWSVLAAGGFFATFAFGQAASLGSAPMAVVLVSRIAAFAALLAGLIAAGVRPSLKGAPVAVLALMGLFDATALGLVQVAGTLPRPEFAAVAASTFGMVTILLAWAFLKERMGRMQWLAVGMVFAGIGYLAL